jgi:hypothetical protein
MSGGGILRTIPRKCSPLAQIRREQKKPGPLLLVYFMVQVFCGKIPKVYVRECAGVLREDPEGLRTECAGVLREDPEGLCK